MYACVVLSSGDEVDLRLGHARLGRASGSWGQHSDKRASTAADGGCRTAAGTRDERLAPGQDRAGVRTRPIPSGSRCMESGGPAAAPVRWALVRDRDPRPLCLARTISTGSREVRREALVADDGKQRRRLQQSQPQASSRDVSPRASRHCPPGLELSGHLERWPRWRAVLVLHPDGERRLAACFQISPPGRPRRQPAQHLRSAASYDHPRWLL